LQPLDETNNPYESLEKSEYDHQLKRESKNSTGKNLFIRELSSGSNLDVVSEKP
jgi:hypothetical protein